MNENDRYFVKYKSVNGIHREQIGVVVGEHESTMGTAYEVELISGIKITATSANIKLFMNQRETMLALFDYMQHAHLTKRTF
jgi:hypothetical protein